MAAGLRRVKALAAVSADRLTEFLISTGFTLTRYEDPDDHLLAASAVTNNVHGV